MKTLGLCVVALAATICSGYVPGREYHYKTKGKILQEFDKKVHQHAGFMFKTELVFQSKDEHTAVIKLVDPKFRTVNERPPENRRLDWEDGLFASSPFAQEELTKPFEIRCEHGVVKEVKVAQDDNLWSVNIKKAIAAKFVLQTDYSKADILQEADYKDDEFKLDRKNYYQTTEGGIDGQCQVDYEVEDNREENVVKVRKIANFDYCERSTYRYYINHEHYIPLQSEGDINAPLRRTEITHYKLLGTRSKFVVKTMISEEEIVFSPYGPDADFLKGDASISMLLKSTEDIKEAFHIPDDAVTHHDLHFHFHEEPVEIKDAEDLKKEPHHIYHFLNIKFPMEEVAEHFNRIINIKEDNEPYTEIYKEEVMPALFMELANGMTSFNYDELKQFYDTHVIEEAKNNERELIKRRDLFTAALANCGTSSSFMFLKQLIIEKNISLFGLHHLLQQLPLTLKEFSPVLIEEFYTLCTDAPIHDNPSTRKICLLAFSKFVQDQCVAKYENVYVKYNTTEKILCDPELAEKYFQKIVARYEDHLEDSSEFSTFVSVAGNMGTRGSMKYLLKIVHDYSLPTYYRFSAMLDLSTTAYLYPKEVYPFLVSIYFNTSEVHGIRILALDYILMTVEVPIHIVEAIAENLEHEPDHQVAHHTMTAFQQLVEQLDHPNFEYYKEVGKRVIRYLKRVDFKIKYDFRHSFNWGEEVFNDKWRVGGGKEYSYITSNQSYVPQHLSLSVYNFMGHSVENPVQLGYVGYGLDKFFDQIISLKKQKKSIFDVLRRKNRDVNIVEKELKEINDKLHIDTRTHEPVYADFYISAFGRTINVLHVNDTTLPNLLKSGADMMPGLLNYLKDVRKFDVRSFFSGKQFKYITPSMLGVPFYLDISEAGFVYYRNNKMNLNMEPDGQKDDAHVTVNLDVDGHLVQEHARIVMMGAMFPSMNKATGAGIMRKDYASTPLTLKLSVEPDRPKVVFKHKNVSPHVRTHKSFLPFTRVYSTNVVHGEHSLLPCVQYKELKKVEVEWEIYEKKARLNGTIGKTHVLESVGSVKKFLAENSLSELVNYVAHNPLAVPYDLDLIDPEHQENDITVTAETFGYDVAAKYKPAFETVQDGHENYIDSRGDRKACTCLLRVERESRGGGVSQVLTEISYTHTYDDLYHVINVLYDRTPSDKDQHHSKVCYSGSILFPHVDTKKLYELDTANMDPKIEVAADIHFGKNCENDKKIKIRGEMTRTEEHKRMQAELDNPEVQCGSINKDAALYKKCKDDISKGKHYSIKCRKFWTRSLKLRHYSFDIEHENLDSNDTNLFSKLETCVKNGMYFYLDEHRSDEEHPNNKIHVDAKFSAKTDHVDIKVTKPHKIMKFDHVPHPHWIQARSANPFFEYTNKMNLWSRYKWPFCAVESDNVHTFDYLNFELPPIDCYKVLAKDCSHKQLFTVLGKKITHNRFNKAVKVFIPNWRIEALPVSADSDIILRLNGHHVPVTEAEPHFHYETIGGKNVLLFSVSFNGLYYEIKSEQYGVTVYYDGKAIIITLAPYYVGKQCGLCGEYNNNERVEEELIGPKNCIFHNTTDFSYSYAIPEEDCSPIPDVGANCEHHS